MGIATASLVLASGLFVASSSVSVAFAGPDDAAAGETDGPVATEPSGDPQAEPPDPLESTPTATSPQSIAAGPAVPGHDFHKPVSRIGNGRIGLPVIGGPTATKAPPPSKRYDATTSESPQTGPTSVGELGEDAEVVQADARKQAEDPKDPRDPKDPNDPEDPKDPGEGEEEPGWPCWWDDPSDPGVPPGVPPGGGEGGGSGGSTGGTPPVVRPPEIPPMQLPTHPSTGMLPEVPGVPVEPVLDAVTGLATGAAALPFAQISLPVIVVPSVGVPAVPGGGSGAGAAAGSGARPGLPDPRGPGQSGKPSSPPAEKAGPNSQVLSSGTVPPSYRAGYGDYLRAAGLGEVAAIAVSGLTGILALVAAGGLLGYRQARAGHSIRANGPGRFMG